jgi:hypothetical protein
MLKMEKCFLWKMGDCWRDCEKLERFIFIMPVFGGRRFSLTGRRSVGAQQTRTSHHT